MHKHVAACNTPHLATATPHKSSLRDKLHEKLHRVIYENYNCATVKYSESGTIQHDGCCPLPASISNNRCSIQSLIEISGYSLVVVLLSHDRSVPVATLGNANPTNHHAHTTSESRKSIVMCTIDCFSIYILFFQH